MSATRYAKVTLGFGVLLFVFAVIFESLDTARAATFTVCRDGCPYATVQAAVTASAPGAVISVAPGTYEEAVVVSKPVTLRGSGDTVVTGKKGNGLDRFPSFTVAAPSVTIDGFTVGPAAGSPRFDSGIDIGAVAHTTLTNLIVRNVTVGIYANGASGLQIDGASFNSVYTGIKLQSTGTTTIGVNAAIRFVDIAYAPYELDSSAVTSIQNISVSGSPRVAVATNASTTTLSGVTAQVTASAFELSGVSGWTLGNSAVKGTGENAVFKINAGPIATSGVSIQRTRLLNFATDVDAPPGALAHVIDYADVAHADSSPQTQDTIPQAPNGQADLTSQGQGASVLSLIVALPATGTSIERFMTIQVIVLAGAAASAIVGYRMLRSNSTKTTY